MTVDPRVIASIGPKATANAAALETRLASAKIGLSVGTGPCAKAVGSTVADQLARLFPRLVAHGPNGKRHLERAIAWSGSGASVVDGPADLTVVVGDGQWAGDNDVIFAGADGWRAYQSLVSPQPTEALGLGAPASGCLAVLGAFLRIFAEWIPDDSELPGEIAWSLFDWSVGDTDPGPPLDGLDLGELVWGGTGAVAHGAFWAMSVLPPLTGFITLVDPDPHGDQSVERYAGGRRRWLGVNKPEAVRGWLTRPQRNLVVNPAPLDLNRWYDANQLDCVVDLLITTPDSKEARRQAALKLPRASINGWAERFAMGVETFGFTDSRCLACAYPIDAEAVGEVTIIHGETGLDPWRVQDLLDSAEPLRPDEVERIAALFQRPPSEFAGKPLRSIRQHLCAVGVIRPPGAQEAVEVPLGMVSALAGIAVLAEIARLRQHKPTGRRWQWDARLLPTTLNAWAVGRTASCFVCGDDDFKVVYASKYGHGAA
jgi:hypothetical protein